MPMLIFYADESGNTALGLDPSSAEPILKPGTPEYFVLAAVGVRDVSRRPLAEALVAIKKKHFGADVFERDWSTSEIKGSLLNHAANHASEGRTMHAPSAYRALDSVEKTGELIKDLGNLFSRFKPTIFVQVIDKKPMLGRDNEFEPIGFAYAHLHQRIARAVEQNHSGESAMIVADEQKEHEKHFNSGALNRARDSLAAQGNYRPNFNLVLDKPLWIDPKLSSWDREIIQLADIVAFAAMRIMTTGEAPDEPQYLWKYIRPCLSVNDRTGEVLHGGFGIYPTPKKQKLPSI